MSIIATRPLLIVVSESSSSFTVPQQSASGTAVPTGADSIKQDSATQRATATAPAMDSNRTAMPLPEMRTPQNSGYLISAYLVAGTIYVSYLVILLRRWSALRVRQQRNAAASNNR